MLNYKITETVDTEHLLSLCAIFYNKKRLIVWKTEHLQLQTQEISNGRVL